MAEKEIVQLTTHATADFDPEEYIKMCEMQFTGNRKQEEVRKFVLNSLHGIYLNGTITGERLLDLGTGPCCHTVFAASKWFREVVLSDISEPNLAVLREWKAGKRRHQESSIKYMLGLEESGDDWWSRSRQLAGKVRYIVRADMSRDGILEGTGAEGLEFDAVSSVLSQSAASTTLEGHKKVVTNISRLVKPGGHLIVVDTLSQSHYQIGNYNFKCLNVPTEQFRSAIEQSGFHTLYWKEELCHYSLEETTVMFAMVAKKN